MPAIEVRNLHKAYGGTPALRDVTLSVEAGEVFGMATMDPCLRWDDENEGCGPTGVGFVR